MPMFWNLSPDGKSRDFLVLNSLIPCEPVCDEMAILSCMKCDIEGYSEVAVVEVAHRNSLERGSQLIIVCRCCFAKHYPDQAFVSPPSYRGRRFSIFECMVGIVREFGELN